MVLRAFAIGLDRAFIEWGIVPTLPRLSMNSSLRHLAIAEQKTQRDLQDSVLYSTSSEPLRQVHSRPTKRSGLREDRFAGTALEVPVAAQWATSRQPACEASSRWFVRSTPRSLVILVNGWVPLSRIKPERLWPIERLDQTGCDVVCPLLPWNAKVAPGPRAAAFPGRDPCSNIIEMARAAGELLRIVRFARERGHPRVTLCGASLGAHLLALVATLPEANEVDRFILEKPLSFLSDPIRWHARGERTWCQHVADRLERVYRAVSPLDRTPTVDAEKIRIIGATLDQVVPITAVQTVADHFHAPLRQVRASHLYDPDRARRLLRLVTE